MPLATITRLEPFNINNSATFSFASTSVTANVSAGNVLTDNLVYANGVAWTFSNYSNTNVAAYLPTYSGNVSAAYFIGNGSTLTSITGGNVTGQVANALVSGTVYSNAQPNITSVGTLSSLNVTANVSAGNILTNNLLYANGVAWSLGGTYSNTNVAAYLPTYTGNYAGNNVTLTGNISTGSGSGNISGANYVIANYFQGNGALLTGLPASYSNTNVAAYLPTFTGNFTAGNISTTGNITAAYFIGNGSQLTGLPASYSNTNVAAYLPTYTGNFTAGNASISGSITTGSGTGNISGANFVNANYFTGNGSLLSSITGANVNGAVSYATTANSVAGGNVSGQVSNALIAGTVYTNAQPNITSVGTLNGLSVTGNVNVTGNINVTGNLNYSNVTDLVVGDPLIYLGANNTGNLVDLGIVASYNDGSYYHTGFARDHTDGTWKLFTGVSQEPTTVIDWANATYAGFKAGNIITSNANLGNLATANYFSGNGSLLTSITGANVTGTVANANYATYSGTAYSVSGSNVSGDVSGANHANIADVANSVAGGNVTGQVGNALVAGTVYSNAQPNITSVGTLSSLSVTANISAGNILTDNLLYANGVAWSFGGGGSSYSNANVAAYLPTYTGNVSAAYFIGNGSTLTSLTGGNVTGQVANALIAGTVYTAAQPNITSVGTLSSLTVTGLTTATGGVKTGNIIDGTGTNTISVSSTTVGVIGNLDIGTGGVGNLSVSGKSNLGPVGNVIITGGSANYILKTDGTGNLSWIAQSGGGATITDDTSTNSTYYPVYATSSSGTLTTAGITTTKLQFNPSTGQLTVQDLNTLSDATLKEDSHVIDDPFIVLNQLFGMGFTWSESKRKSYGLLAQMLEKVLPELVSVNAQGKKTVNYIPIIAFLIEAVKKQQQDIEALKKDKY